MMRKLDIKGALDMADPFFMAIGVLVLFIAINLFIPFADLLDNVASNMTNGSIFMTVVWTIPLLMVGMLIYQFVSKMKEPRY